MAEETVMPHAEYLSLSLSQARIVKADHVAVESGILWLTQSGSPADVLLRAGQSFHRERPGRIVIQPLGGDATLRLQSDGIAAGMRAGIGRASAALSAAWRRLSDAA